MSFRVHLVVEDTAKPENNKTLEPWTQPLKEPLQEPLQELLKEPFQGSLSSLWLGWGAWSKPDIWGEIWGFQTFQISRH